MLIDPLLEVHVAWLAGLPELHLILELLFEVLAGRSRLSSVEVLENAYELVLAFEKWIRCIIKTTCIDSQGMILVPRRVNLSLELRRWHAKVYQYCDVRNTTVAGSNALMVSLDEVQFRSRWSGSSLVRNKDLRHGTFLAILLRFEVYWDNLVDLRLAVTALDGACSRPVGQRPIADAMRGVNIRLREKLSM